MYKDKTNFCQPFWSHMASVLYNGSAELQVHNSSIPSRIFGYQVHHGQVTFSLASPSADKNIYFVLSWQTNEFRDNI